MVTHPSYRLLLRAHSQELSSGQSFRSTFGIGWSSPNASHATTIHRVLLLPPLSFSLLDLRCTGCFLGITLVHTFLLSSLDGGEAPGNGRWWSLMFSNASMPSLISGKGFSDSVFLNRVIMIFVVSALAYLYESRQSLLHNLHRTEAALRLLCFSCLLACLLVCLANLSS